VLLRSLIKNHPLVDGNKRLALATTFVFLLMNRRVLLASNRRMVDFALEVAKSEPDISWRRIARWIRQQSASIDDADEVAAKMQVHGPDLQTDIPRAVERAQKWVREYRQWETEMRQKWKAEGFDEDVMFELLADAWV